MNRFNNFIEKRNFKKIFIVYVITAVICGILCAAGVGYVYRNKINLAIQYENAGKAVKGQHGDAVQSLEKLAASSEDIKDILILDDQNNITFSAKKTNLAWDSSLDLKKDGKFLVSEKNSNVAFRFVKKDEFMLSAVFADDFGKIRDEYDEEYFYLNNFRDKKLYMISMLGSDKDGVKVYAISDPTPVAYGMLSLKAAAGVLMLLFMIYWIIIAMWVYQNAARSKLCAPAWGIVTLFTNLAGVLVYVIYKSINKVCPFCGAVQSAANLFCTCCGKKIGASCENCGHALRNEDNYCPKCGNKVK